LHSSWRAENAEWLSLALERLRLQLNRRALWLQRPSEQEWRGADWLLAAPNAELEARFYEEDAGAKAIAARIAAVALRSTELETRMRTTSRPPALRLLTKIAGLSPFEESLLLLASAPALDGAFARAYAELHDDPRRAYASLHLALGLFLQGVAERLLAGDCLGSTRPLRGLRLLDLAEDSSEPLLTRALGVDERITNFLRGVNRPDMRLSPFLSVVKGGLGSEGGSGAARKVSTLIKSAPERWLTINLIGSVQGGARDAASQVCDELGVGLRTLNASRLVVQAASERAGLLALLGRDALLSRFALLIDTAGIEAGSAAATLVDDVIDRVAATLFVVSAERWPGENGAEMVHVARPTRTEQRALWQTALAEHEHTVNGELDSIVQQFDFGPPAIAAVLAHARALGDGPMTGPQIWRSCREHCGAELAELARRITPCYDWNDIVVTGDVRAQLRELASQVGHRGRVYENWGFGAQLGRGRGISALFAGPSGTGKTMAAEILAAHLELDLYRVDLAGVVSKYIGETEKNLRRVFDAAERSGAILFFDEADALFGTRTDVRDSHDRYANVEINYLLQRMEDYTGLAILATNRRGALDGAFLRRLRFVIDFPFPSVEDRRRIWESVFPPKAALDTLEFAFLSRLELTGGNIRSIAVNAAFLAAAERESIGMRHLVRAAAREYGKLSKPLTAAEFGPFYAMARP
jgi:hypothetical protein